MSEGGMKRSGPSSAEYWEQMLRTNYRFGADSLNALMDQVATLERRLAALEAHHGTGAGR